jgi:hypothetical protein
MNLSNKKLLTDLNYGNTNKSTIVSFDQLLAHPKYKQQIEPALMNILDINSSDDIFLLDNNNRQKIIEEVNKFNFINIPKEYKTESKSNSFFNNNDCLSIKEDLLEVSNEFLDTNLTNNHYTRDKDYAINHFNLTSQLGLFKYNKNSQKLELSTKSAIIFNENGRSEIPLPKITIEINNDKLKNYIDRKYNEKVKNKIFS